jgi:hypothetical protein
MEEKKKKKRKRQGKGKGKGLKTERGTRTETDESTGETQRSFSEITHISQDSLNLSSHRIVHDLLRAFSLPYPHLA